MVPDEEFCDGVRVMGGDGGRDGEDDGVRGIWGRDSFAISKHMVLLVNLTAL